LAMFQFQALLAERYVEFCPPASLVQERELHTRQVATLEQTIADNEQARETAESSWQETSRREHARYERIICDDAAAYKTATALETARFRQAHADLVTMTETSQNQASQLVALQGDVHVLRRENEDLRAALVASRAHQAPALLLPPPLVPAVLLPHVLPGQGAVTSQPRAPRPKKKKKKAEKTRMPGFFDLDKDTRNAWFEQMFSSKTKAKKKKKKSKGRSPKRLERAAPVFGSKKKKKKHKAVKVSSSSSSSSSQEETSSASDSVTEEDSEMEHSDTDPRTPQGAAGGLEV